MGLWLWRRRYDQLGLAHDWPGLAHDWPGLAHKWPAAARGAETTASGGGTDTMCRTVTRPSWTNHRHCVLQRLSCCDGSGNLLLHRGAVVDTLEVVDTYYGARAVPAVGTSLPYCTVL